MSPALRPMTVGEILDRIWWIVRRRPAMFAGIGMVPMGALLVCIGGVFGLLSAFGAFPTPNPVHDPAKLVMRMFLTMSIGMIPMMCVFALFQAAACDAALCVNRGMGATWAGAYRAAVGKTGRYFWLMLLCAMAVSAPQLLLFAAFGMFGLLLTHGSTGMWFVLLPIVILGYVGSLVYMVWMMLRVGLAYPASVAENLPAMPAMRRSFLLTRTGKGRMFVVMLVVYAISYAGMMIFEAIVMAIAAILGLVGMTMHLHASEPLSIAGWGLGGIVALSAFLLVMALMYAAYAISLTVLYEDQVLRTDGPAALIGGAA